VICIRFPGISITPPIALLMPCTLIIAGLEEGYCGIVRHGDCK
jgi:hypothetical protein